jgi:uncharacterized cupredoxin-like copper-binding protein
MKRWFGSCVLLVLVCIVFAACSASVSLGSASTSSGLYTQSNVSQGVSSRSSSAGTPQTVNVLEGEMYIKSDVTSFTVGTPYHFVVKNQGQVVHEFTIAKKVPGGNQAARDAASIKDVDNIQPGQTVTSDLTFTQPAPPVGMEFECSYPGHYEMGMHMDITVK